MPSGGSSVMKIIMEKLRPPLLGSWDEFWCSSSRAFRVLRYSTQTLAPNDAATTLYHRLVRIREPSILPVLEQWVGEGRPVDQEDLHRIIKQLRKFSRYQHALEICQWMNNKPYLDVSYKSISVELDLISKLYGLNKAEDYFNQIPNNLRVWQIYGALLNCYAEARSLEKAESTMQKMRELGYSKPLAYNVMMGLYSTMLQYEKLDLLMEEMEQKGIRIDKFTYAIRLNAYAKTSKIPKMEKLLLKMEADPEIQMEWHAYTTVANGYLKTGNQENIKKAVNLLKKSEYLVRPSQLKPAYENLLTLYASAGRKSDVYRVWGLYKNMGKFYNHGYRCMMSSLAKLDCIDDVAELYEEWEKGCEYFDFQIPNLVITVYCKKGLIEKAEGMVKRLIETGHEPNASTWSRMAFGYVKNGGMEKAAEAMRKSILSSYKEWSVDTVTLAAILEYLDRNGNVDEVKEMIGLLERKGHLTQVVYEGIVKKLSNPSIIDRTRDDRT